MVSEYKERLKRILLENSILRGKFTLASGMESEYYIDARLTTLHPEGAYLVAEIMLDEIKKDPLINAVGSILSASHRQDYPLNGFLVRKQEKGHGTGKLIEGNLKPEDHAAIVEDVVTTGGSVIAAINAVLDSGARVRKVLVIVDREEGAERIFRDMGIDFYSIFRISELLER